MKLSYLKIQEAINNINLEDYPKLHISILRNIMLEPIEPYLRYLAYEIGFNAQIKFGEYDNLFQEAVGGSSSLLSNKTDCVLVFTKLETLSWNLARNFAALDSDEIQSELLRIHNYIVNIIEGIKNQTNGIILWHGFELLAYPSLGIYDSQLDRGQLATIQDLNLFLQNHLTQQENCYFVNLNLSLARLGINSFFDNRYWHIGKAPYTREALADIASEDFKYIRALKGKNKKCLVLDCDNTLWGGIIGEDGLAGIQLSKTHPGSAFYEFQQEILNLYNRGILIALCSKNNEQDVWEVFRKHPDMLLKEEHITTAQINWNDKATNLKQIAKDLNIGLDSLVFIDDSEFEVNLIHDVLPEVEVIHLSKNKSIEYRNNLAACGLFDTLTISEEDKKRASMYKAEASRKKIQAQITNMEEYYISLEMIPEILFADTFSIPRIAQLTQKTNQFNLTTKRYSEADIKTFVDSKNYEVIYLKLQDKFGNYGIVGVSIIHYVDYQATFDSFLLSCRVLGRKVEDIFIQQVLKLAQNRGYDYAFGLYVPTLKNKQVENFYPQQGFEEVDYSKDNTSQRIFRYDLSSQIQIEPRYFKHIVSDITKQGEKNERTCI
ncbi:HAD-IIIC family phosphatase [Rivularia sp. UHCC 0363]|uniref:HAD-IIIC family phosphatase n=1 Tax=Rivularia sp. UHCC 0363 TaxID=3110244 RepID=UPI002B1F5148|nr:HAD-IIIC family phosphatase [Rivularia sp. UHCC 0363]MEA5598795.1 HAD-IIIC family phosphatase [Rivularia sp. UHCC 0363]